MLCKSTLFYNTNFVYCFYYYIIIELVSFLAATAQKGTFMQLLA